MIITVSIIMDTDEESPSYSSPHTAPLLVYYPWLGTGWFNDHSSDTWMHQLHQLFHFEESAEQVSFVSCCLFLRCHISETGTFQFMTKGDLFFFEAVKFTHDFFGGPCTVGFTPQFTIILMGHPPVPCWAASKNHWHVSFRIGRWLRYAPAE